MVDEVTGDLFADPPRKKRPRKPIARRTDPETSHEAAKKAEPRTSKLDAKIIAYLEGCGTRGSTTLEMSQATGMVHNNISPRFKPLALAGHIVRRSRGGNKYEKRRGSTGASSIVWWAKGMMPC